MKKKDFSKSTQNETNTTNNPKLTIPSFSFDLQLEEADKSESLNKSADEINSNENENANNNNPQTTNNTSSSEKLHKPAPKITDYYSKFLTANNILTDRGGIVNIRTGSFNLGCQQNAISSSSLSPDNSLSPSNRRDLLNDEELIDSNEFFNSLQHDSLQHNEYMKNSLSNYSFKNSTNHSFYSSIDNYSASNLLVPLLLVQNRRKNSSAAINPNKPQTNSPIPSIHTDSNENLLFDQSSNKQNTNSSSLSPSGNFLTVSMSPNEQDQLRRCSHDPNIEKLHKSYISNVKLGAAQVFSSVSVSTSNTDSIPNINTPPALAKGGFDESMMTATLPFKFNKKQSYLENFKSSKSSEQNYSIDSNDKIPMESATSKSANAIQLDESNRIESEKSDVLNEIFKVNKWLRDNSKAADSSKKDFNNYSKSRLNKLPSMTISEDEDNMNFTNESINKSNSSSTNNPISSCNVGSNINSSTGTSNITKSISQTSTNNTTNNSNNNSANRNSTSYYEDDNDETDAKTKYSYETADSAIDIRSYG